VVVVLFTLLFFYNHFFFFSPPISFGFKHHLHNTTKKKKHHLHNRFFPQFFWFLSTIFIFLTHFIPHQPFSFFIFHLLTLTYSYTNTIHKEKQLTLAKPIFTFSPKPIFCFEVSTFLLYHEHSTQN